MTVHEPISNAFFQGCLESSIKNVPFIHQFLLVIAVSAAMKGEKSICGKTTSQSLVLTSTENETSRGVLKENKE